MKVPVQSQQALTGSRRRRAAVAVAAVLVAGLGLAFLHDLARRRCAGAVQAMGGAATGELWTDLATLQGEAWPRQRAAEQAGATVPTLRFDVKFRHVRKLAHKRTEALQRNYLLQEDGDYVPATIRVEDGAASGLVRAKIRLKGDFTDHLRGDKWSFRVKTKDDGHVLGMRVFSVQHPRTRGYAHEPVFLDYARRHGVLAPRYFMVRLVVNGQDKGLMALEEHFGKELLEAQERREGVIVRFDETLKWRTLHLMGQEANFAAPYPLVRPFQAAKVAADPALRAQLDAAISLLRAFLTGKLPPSRVFDPAATARFLAVCEVFGAEHSLAWNNMRFYFNPLTGLLEPIVFDANLQDYAFRFIDTALVSVYTLRDTISTDWLADEAIRGPFLRDLARLVEEFQQPATQEWLQQREAALTRVLHREFPLIAPIPFHFYAMRAERLARVDAGNYAILPLMPPNYPALAHAFVQPTARGHLLELYNLVPYPLQVTGITAAAGPLQVGVELPLTLPPTVGLAAPAPARIELVAPPAGDPARAPAQLQVAAWIPGYPDTRTTLPATPYPPTATAPVLPEGDWAALGRDHPFVRRVGDAAAIGPGEFAVDRPLVLPRGTDLTIEPGTTLRFGPDALLLVRGALRMPGTAELPIRLGARTAAGGWCGVAVFGAGRDASESAWSHVEIEDTTGLRLGSWRPTGSVMVYESTVRLQRCAIRRNRAEDALNLVRCAFTLDEVEVTGATSDAVDLDFCAGTVTGGVIQDARGDGIDVSGTRIEVRGTRLLRIADKALSVGERSTLRARAVTIRACGTGLASKDGSSATIEDSTMASIEHVAVMAYAKKPEYGGARIEARGLTIEQAGHDYLAQIGSAVRAGDRDIEPVELDVDALYETGYMRKDR